MFTGSPVAGPILCFFLFESLWCLNEVAKDRRRPGRDTHTHTNCLFSTIRLCIDLENLAASDQVSGEVVNGLTHQITC